MTEAETMDHVEPPPVDDTKPEEKMTPAQEAQREADSRSPAGTEYDTPPKEWAPGTKYDPETDPDDMTDAEYIQWMYDNHTPFWAIKRNMLYRTAPVLTTSSRRRRRLARRISSWWFTATGWFRTSA